jgi:histidinol-phosphate phosphatase family protein
MSNKAVFIDRDGTIIFDSGYIKDVKEVKLIPKVKDALKKIKEKNFLIFIITNQSGIARGYMTIKEVEKINIKIIELIGENIVEEFLICPHHPDENCKCRKPNTALVDKVVKKYNINLKKSYSIGDKISDKKLAENFGGVGIQLGKDAENLYKAINLLK